MHELVGSFTEHESKIIELAVFHVGFFILIYQSFLLFQSLIKSIIFSAILIWVTGTYSHGSIYGVLLGGLVFSAFTVWSLKYQKIESTGYEIYYHILQPLVFYVFLPLYIPQTKYPVGIVLTFLIWAIFNLVLRFNEWPIIQQAFHYISIILLFFLLFWFIHSYWYLILCIVCLQILLLMIHRIFFRKKKK